MAVLLNLKLFVHQWVRLLVNKFKCLVSSMSALVWGYDQENGPKTWANYFPEAAGTNQSPIDIKTSDGLRVPTPSVALSWKYSPDIVENLNNTGHGWKVVCNHEGSELKGGPLQGIYQLEQFHCHWGKDNSEGSEHTVDGQPYAGELHLVHRNVTKYDSAEGAAMNSDGFCVLGIFLKPGNHNEEFEKLTSLMSNIIYKDQSVNIDEPVDIKKFIPSKSGYYTYYGSLTTPPCSECVIWIVFQDPIEVSNEQLETFRQLKYVCEDEDCGGNYMFENFRPPNPVGERTIRRRSLKSKRKKWPSRSRVNIRSYNIYF